MVPFENEAEAIRAKRAAVRRLPGRVTVGQAVEAYRRHLEAKGNKPGSVKLTSWRILAWHDEDEPIGDVTPAQAAAAYRRRQNGRAVDTHRNELAEVKTFWRWAIRAGFVTSSPADHVEPVGRRKRGKPQLRTGEARRFYAQALLRAQAGEEAALALLMVIGLGMRSDEVRSRQVRDLDLDDGLAILWIDEGKTAAAARRVEIPDELAGLLRNRVAGRPAAAWIFPSPESASGYRGDTWLRKHTLTLCKAAGVPYAPPHGLRGTHATIARSAGATGQLVAAQLGHEDERTTQDHYIALGADAQARAREAWRVVAGGNSD